MVNLLRRLGYPDRYPPRCSMRKIGTRYLFFCVTMICICLSFWTIPHPPPYILNAENEILSQPYWIHEILFQIRPYVLILAVSLFMHALCSVIGLTTVARWVTSILLPSTVAFAWQIWNLTHSPPKLSIPIWMALAATFVLFTISFATSFGFASLLFRMLNVYPKTNTTEYGG